MKRTTGASQFRLIHHLRIPLPYSYESWSSDLTVPYENLKTLTAVVGLGYLGAQNLPSKPTTAECMKEVAAHGRGRYMTKNFTEATFGNDIVLMWTPPECFVYSYIQRRDEANGSYKIYVQSRPDIPSELERKDIIQTGTVISAFILVREY